MWPLAVKTSYPPKMTATPKTIPTFAASYELITPRKAALSPPGYLPTLKHLLLLSSNQSTHNQQSGHGMAAFRINLEDQVEALAVYGTSSHSSRFSSKTNIA